MWSFCSKRRVSVRTMLRLRIISGIMNNREKESKVRKIELMINL